MQRIATSDNVASLPAAATPGNTPGYFAQSTNPIYQTTVSPDWVNSVQEEICNVITNAGITLAVGTTTQLLASINSMISGATPVIPAHGMSGYGNAGSGSFTVPTGITKVYVQVWGAGGGSGGTYGTGSASQGGGGGGYSEGWMTVTSGGTVAYVVGAGGAGGTAASTPTAGSTGGTSSVASTFYAYGGAGGAAANATNSQAISAGGTATGGQLNISGSASSGTIQLTSSSVWTSAGGAAFMGGNAHPGATATSANGTPGIYPGGGAGGAAAQAAGAVGANGLVIFRW